MSEPDLTLRDINQRILITVDVIRESLTEQRRAGRAWVDAVRKYKKARSVAFLQSTAKTVPGKEAEVTLATDEQWYEAELAGVLRDSAKEALRANESIMSGLQSVSSAWRADAQLAKYESREMASA